MPDSDGKYSGFYAMLEKPLNPDLISANLSTAGMIGDPVQPKTGETVGNVQSEWASLVEQMRQNPAVSEYHLNLPLLASADAYMKDGKDIRANVPEGEPTYSFGRYDLNGDQTPEYMIRAQIDGAKAGTVGGYWAILEPTPSGLQVVNVIPEGNGDLIRKDDRIILPALVASEKGLTLSLNEMKLGETSVNPSLPDVLFEKTGNLTGAELAKKYPEDRLVVIGEAVYRFKMKDFDRFADYALNQMVGAEKLDFIGPMVDGETGEENPDGMQGQKLDDVMTYLQDRYPNLPLSQEKLKKAAPTSTFKDLDRPVDAGDFDRVE